jgi:hypothetical protein
MSAAPGNNYNPKGRGSAPNKTTKEIREAYQAFVENNIDDFQVWLSQIDDPAKRFQIIIQISEYFVPKLNRTEVTGQDGKDLFSNVTFNFTVADDDSDQEQL